LGDPTRLAIFEASARRPRTVGELARELGVAQPTVSNHVRILRDADLIGQEKGGGRRLQVDLPSFERYLQESLRAVVRSGADITPLA
jgi:ArsR family transcriptional regulator